MPLWKLLLISAGIFVAVFVIVVGANLVGDYFANQFIASMRNCVP